MSELIDFPDEVVTHAPVHYVDLPHAAGTAALITLDNGFDHTKPTTFGPQGMQNIGNAIDEALGRDDVVAVAVTGKPFIFAVGADLKVMEAGGTPAQARAYFALGHDTFRKLRDATIPTFALVNGAVLGGGLELALHCHYRTFSAGVPAIAFPEVFLGLVPGWGGSQLLPNLVGADNAVTVIVENAMNQNRMLRAKQAFDLGIADVLLEPADFLEESLEWVSAVVRGETTVSRPEVDRGDAWDAAIARAKGIADMRVHGATPAPYKAIELLELARTASYDDGIAAERTALFDLAMGEDLRAGLYAFDLVQHRAKRPAGVPDRSLAREVTKVGVVGAGLMASQLAMLFLQRLEVPVVLTDLDQDRVDKGVGYVKGEIDKLLAKGRINPDKANRYRALVTGSTTKDVFADADFVIEAVFEEMKVKAQVFAELEAVVSPECVLATNTSSLSVTEMASQLEHPERVVGFHFFNPVAVLPLLEIARAEKTDDVTVATAFAVGKTLKKSCVLVADRPAFVVNRLLTRFLGEVTRAVDEGTPFQVADKALEPLGLPLTPFVLLALVGPAVALHVAETMHEAFPDRFYVSENLGRLVAAGKTGIYVWEGSTPSVDPEVAELFQQGSTPLAEDEVRRRALDALAEEIRIMLDERVVSDVRDIDLAMLLGAGWPFHLGGVTPYLDRAGVSERVTGGRFLPPGVASLPPA
ncbi:MAG TPA: 3-hydroxyacyl-CoA dehydrogenase NAD-binding domain-containing protein [Actinomycetes bacterium]